MTIRFVTDSICGVPPAKAAEYGIDRIVPLFVRFGDDQYVENVSISIDEFHAKLKSDPRFPTTAAPSVGDFEEAFLAYKGDTVICINVSRELSGTIAAAENARQMVDGEVHVIDSRSAAAGQLLLIQEAQRMAKAGKNGEEIKTAIEKIIPKMKLHLLVDTLENLKRGGRIGGAQAMIGSLLNMKPILTLKDGKLQPLERVRTFGKAVQRMKEIVSGDLQGKQGVQLAVLHVQSLAAGKELATDLQKSLNLSYLPMVQEVGAAVATHAGPGAVGVVYYTA